MQFSKFINNIFKFSLFVSKMFNDHFNCRLSGNRQLETPLDQFSDVTVENHQAHEYAIDSILWTCDQIGLKKETKWLIKRSLDIFVLTFNNACPQRIFQAASNLFLIAIKFNEDPIFYEELDMNLCLQKLNYGMNPYQIQDLISFQAGLYNFTEFSLNFTTPYDYLGLFSSTFLMDGKMINRIKWILDFSFTIPELMLSSAQELFFGSLLMIYREKKMHQQWILRQTISRQKVQNVADIIRRDLQKKLEEAAEAAEELANK